MKIAVLSRASHHSQTASRLKEAAKKRGHSLRLFNTLKFSLHLESHNPSLVYKGKELTKLDAILPRIGASITFAGVSLVRQFEQMNIYTPNTARAISRSRDKLRCFQTLSRHTIPFPTTAFVQSPDDLEPAMAKVGGPPFVIKVLEGTQGIGVILAQSVETAKAIVETLQSQNISILLQRFVAESRGVDIRAFVIGKRVVAAVRRQAQGEEFRSNVHRGGVASSVELEPAYKDTAVRCAQILGLNIAGVDLLEGKDGPLVMEVNSSPGLVGMEDTTKVDIAGEIIDYLEQQVQFPDIDLRQRMTATGESSVVDVVITPKTQLAGQTISDSELSRLGVNVLSIERNNKILSNPEPNEMLKTGDKILCFGKQDALKRVIALVQKQGKKRSRKSK